MPAVSFDSKSFLLPTGRGAAIRFAVVGAAFDPTLVDPERWVSTLGTLRHAGFNTVVIRVPWLLHEPTPDRFVWTGACDLRRAVQAAGAAGLKVMLRIGPCVGGGFARGGLPGWVAASGERAREAHPAFMARVTRYWHALAPQFVDLQASRNGGGAPRPVIAVGIEDDWRCLDTAVGGAYFGALVRFAREVGIDVPLFTANNCWYAHEGVIDAWSGGGAAAGELPHTADELRQVHPEAPPFFLHAVGAAAGGTAAAVEMARLVAESVAARADFACEVVDARHRGATSAAGCAEREAVDLFPLRRALVLANTFGGLLATMTPGVARVEPDGRTVVPLQGSAGERIDVLLPAQGEKRRRSSAKTDGRAGGKAAGNAAGAVPHDIAFRGHGLAIAGARLELGGGSLVALLDDLVVVTGPARAKLAVKVDGSEAMLAVPADGAAPKVTKVRGLRVATVPVSLAAGVGLADDAIEFVDTTGALLARIARDGSVVRHKPKAPSVGARASIPLAAAQCVVETGLLDGTHARFAPVAAPGPLGEFGVGSMHGYYCARFTPPRQKGREVWVDGGGIARSTRVAVKPRGIALVVEARGDALPATGGHLGEHAGIVGPLREVAPLKGVKGALVDLPRFDATRLGRFVWGYEARADSEPRRTVRWTFAARSSPVVVVLPDWWLSDVRVSGGTVLRLNDEIAVQSASPARGSFLLDGARLSPMRPRKLAKGEKPPKAKAVTLEPGANELLLDLDPGVPADERMLKRLLADTRFLDVAGEVKAVWSFARISPPAGWSASTPLPRKPIAAPAWFRTTFTVEAPRALELEATHAAGSVATVLVNGEGALVLDGASGVAGGTARKRTCTRTAQVPASLVRAGENEICVFGPDGVMPALALRPIPNR